MNIIVVGPDGTGKSTLVSRLSEDLMMPVYHGRGVHGDKKERWETLSSWDNVIFDRAYLIDDQVYAPIVGETPLEWPSESKLIEDSFVIYWDNYNAFDILKSRGDDYITPNMLGDVRKGYDSFFTENPNLSPDVIIIINSFDTVEDHIDTLKRMYLERRNKG